MYNLLALNFDAKSSFNAAAVIYYPTLKRFEAKAERVGD
jgi:hypothetical protein